MAIVGLGIDLARTPRFSRLANERPAVLARLFTSGELAYAHAAKDPAQRLAARFAAKEAFLKALGLGLRDGLRWQDIEVVRDPLGKPSLTLHGRARQLLSERAIATVHLSYSHDGDYAVATVILESA